MDSINVTISDVDFTMPDGVTIRNTALLNQLALGDRDEVLNLFGAGGNTVDLGQIEVDSIGRVVINNSGLRFQLLNEFANLSPDELAVKNGLCGAGC
jgi:hypothetical protein